LLEMSITKTIDIQLSKKIMVYSKIGGANKIKIISPNSNEQ